jgi:hypothetical protein
MKKKLQTKARGSLSALFALGSCCLLGGCFNEDHYTHREFISPATGDAVAVNAATHTINPWPKEAKNPNVDVDGKRLTAAVQRYQDNRSIPPRGLNTTKVTEQAGPGPQLDTSIQK